MVFVLQAVPIYCDTKRESLTISWINFMLQSVKSVCLSMTNWRRNSETGGLLKSAHCWDITRRLVATVSRNVDKQLPQDAA
jgi:hypothetical protein